MAVNLVARQKVQRERIEVGVRNGQLTQSEAQKAGSALRSTHQHIVADRWDGAGLNRKESTRAQMKLDQVSRGISQLKLN
ncbi:MAG: hypothetical protein VKO64_03740 [Candidatus Sericytochromatia bacterium]|nr:hypothetical protein [Candidatus Sericytochromatia bacterium]